jgi:hypothetical protein
MDEKQQTTQGRCLEIGTEFHTEGLRKVYKKATQDGRDDPNEQLERTR